MRGADTVALVAREDAPHKQEGTRNADLLPVGDLGLPGGFTPDEGDIEYSFAVRPGASHHHEYGALVAEFFG